MRIGIRARLLAAFIAVALFTGALGWYALQTMERLNDGQRTVYGDVFGGTYLLTTWVDTSWQARENLSAVLLSDDRSEWTRVRADMATLDGRLRELANEMDRADTDREDVATLASLMAAWDTYALWRDTAVIGPLERGDRPAAVTAYRTEGLRLASELDTTIDAFVEKKREVGANLEGAAEGSYDLTRRIAIVLSVAAAGLGLGIGFFLSRSIANAVHQVAAAAKGLAVGNLDQRIQVPSRDELGQMAEAFREMITYQQDMARVADAMAHGDLTQNVRPKGPTDQLGTAFQHMIGNLRTLVGQLETAVDRAHQLAEVAEEREARMRAVMDSVADAIVTFDEHGVIEAFNPTAERIFQYSADEIVGRHVSTLLANASGAPAIGTRQEMDALRRDRSTFPIDLAVSEMRLADRRLSIASIRDVSERKRAEAKFAGLLESAPDAIVTVNREGRIVLVNTQAERLFGYDRSELLGQMVETLLPAEAREKHAMQHRPTYMASPGTRPMGAAMKLRACRKSGADFPAEISLSPMDAEDGLLTISVIRDITDRVRAEANQRFLSEASALLAVSLDYETTLASIARLAVPYLADACIVDVVDEDGTPHLVAAASAPGSEDANPQLSSQLSSLRLKPLLTGQPHLLSTRSEDPNDSEALDQLRALDVGAAMLVPLVVRGRSLGVISFLVGASGRQYGPADLVLAQELGHRCAIALENAQLYREAQSAIHLRDDFFSVASHELKTPVAALLAFTQFILKRARRQRGIGLSQTREVLEEVHWQSERIARLVSHLLDTSRLDAGKLTLKPERTNVAALLSTAVDSALANTDKHTISLVAPSEVLASVDAVYFEQVITNLLDNAVKYSPNGGRIDVELAGLDDGRVRLSVRDHGVGVPLADRAHIFDRFYQAQARQHIPGVAGMGLGLYISRRIVEMHGGSIELESPHDGGACILVTVPVGAVGPQAQRKPRRPRASTSPLTLGTARAG